MTQLRLTLEFDDKKYGMLYEDVEEVSPEDLGNVVRWTVEKYFGIGQAAAMLPVEEEKFA